MFSAHYLRVLGCAVLLGFVGREMRAQPLTLPDSTHSISGQFVVTTSDVTSRLATAPKFLADTNLIRLQPALLTVSAERIKQSLWNDLGLKPNSPWRGKIFLAIHPAQSLDEDVTIVIQPVSDHWNYVVQLPDILKARRFVRAMTSVVLLELANRNANPKTHSSEVPTWLVDGFCERLMASSPDFVLSSPQKTLNGVLQSQQVQNERGLDPLAVARKTLREHNALTFEQLNWPDETQLVGDDGGVYRASAQLFVSNILELKNGANKLRALLDNLSANYNGQVAFQKTYHDNFPRPLDLEKWWALQVVSFLSRDPGPQWTPAVSRDKLAEILSVPVQIRANSNSLPEHAVVSLQTIIRNFDSSQQTDILETKLRDLEVAQFRVARQLAPLTEGYRLALGEYLGETKVKAPLTAKHAPEKASAHETLKKLDELDSRRRILVAKIKPDIMQTR